MRRPTARGTFAFAAFAFAALLMTGYVRASSDTGTSRRPGLWGEYDNALASARYIDLTHTISPAIPVWKGFARSSFGEAVKPGTGKPYSYQAEGFVATQYRLGTDQLGTQLDLPAHWDPHRPAIDELPPTFAVRPLVVISIVDKVRKNFNYALQVGDIRSWERQHGQIPPGSVVFVRSDWSRRWPDPKLATLTKFPGVSLAALQFLHLQRHILFHGHEPLDTDSTATLEGEAWLMHHGYAQAEAVGNLDRVPATGCLVSIGYPKFRGGVGGYARYVAICPSSWRYGVRIRDDREAPLPYVPGPLHWNPTVGARTR